MQFITTTVARSGVCVSVCLYVCVCSAHGWAVQNKLNRSRCRSWAQETLYWMGVLILSREGAILRDNSLTT